MDLSSLFGSGFYTWFILPFLIFIARILDVSLGTVRVIFISRGLKYLAPLVGFFEIMIWLLAIGQVMKNLNNVACFIAYGGGFAMGNFVGMCIAEKLSLGVVLIRILTSQDVSGLLDLFRTDNYRFTSIDGQGAFGPVKVIFTIVPRREVESVVNLVKKFNPQAFYSIEEIGFVEKRVFPARQSWFYVGLANCLRPFRKGK